jgi:hypothetical protein
MKEQLGIAIIPILIGNTLTYKTKISKQKRNQLFVSNPTIRKIIEQQQYPVGKYVGYTNIEFFNGNAIIKKFYPIGICENPNKKNQPFVLTGTASLIETRIIKDIQKRFPKIKSIITNPSWTREAQLKKIGLTRWELMGQTSFKKFQKLLRRKTAQDIRKHRKK